MSNDRTPSPWPLMVCLGILCGLALGAVVVLLTRKGKHHHMLAGGVAPTLPELSFDQLLSEMDPPRTTRVRTPPNRTWNGKSLAKVTAARTVPVARTTTISQTSPTLLLQAVGQRDWTIWARTVGPPGAFATFMISDNEGNSVVVPAGGFQMMKIPCGEFLYAQGDMADVSVSVSGGQD